MKRILLSIIASVSIGFANTVPVTNGWNLVGASTELNVSDIPCVKTAWLFERNTTSYGSWSLYTNSSYGYGSASSYGFSEFNTLGQGNAAWVNIDALNSCGTYFTVSLNNTISVGQTISTSYGVNESSTFSFTAQAGSSYAITTSNISNDTYLELYDSDGTTLIASNDDYCSLESRIVFEPTQTGIYYFKVRELGNGSGYCDVSLDYTAVESTVEFNPVFTTRSLTLSDVANSYINSSYYYSDTIDQMIQLDSSGNYISSDFNITFDSNSGTLSFIYDYDNYIMNYNTVLDSTSDALVIVNSNTLNNNYNPSIALFKTIPTYTPVNMSTILPYTSYDIWYNSCDMTQNQGRTFETNGTVSGDYWYDNNFTVNTQGQIVTGETYGDSTYEQRWQKIYSVGNFDIVEYQYNDSFSTNYIEYDSQGAWNSVPFADITASNVSELLTYTSNSLDYFVLDVVNGTVTDSYNGYTIATDLVVTDTTITFTNNSYEFDFVNKTLSKTYTGTYNMLMPTIPLYDLPFYESSNTVLYKTLSDTPSKEELYKIKFNKLLRKKR